MITYRCDGCCIWIINHQGEPVVLDCTTLKHSYSYFHEQVGHLLIKSWGFLTDVLKKIVMIWHVTD